jgi:kynureninase
MGRRFITEADIKAAMQNAAAKGAPAVFKLDPLGRSVLAILRHYGRIREVRTPGVVRFVIL